MPGPGSPCRHSSCPPVHAVSVYIACAAQSRCRGWAKLARSGFYLELSSKLFKSHQKDQVMVRDDIRQTIANALADAQGTGRLPAFDLPSIEIARPKQAEHGDYSSNVAMVVAA